MNYIKQIFLIILIAGVLCIPSESRGNIVNSTRFEKNCDFGNDMSVNASASTNMMTAARQTITEERNIAPYYTEIVLSHCIRMIVETRKDGAAIIEAPEIIMPYIVLNVENGILYAGIASKGQKMQNISVEIKVPNSGCISMVKLSGVSTLSIVPPIIGKKFGINLSGATEMFAKVNSAECKAIISGASSLELGFKGDRIGLRASGPSNATLDLQCIESSFDLSGASTVIASGSCDDVESDISGASKLLSTNLLPRQKEENRYENQFYTDNDNFYLATNREETSVNSPILTPSIAANTSQSTNTTPIVKENSPQTTTIEQVSPVVSTALSDVDINIPATQNISENTFVLVIANEHYAFVDDVEFALNDGEIFREYCIKTLGVPERQVWFYKNASLGIILGGVDKMVQAMNIFDDAKAIVYYCGHGIPDEKTGDAYLVPTDGKGTNVATCYSLNKLYKTLSESKAKSVTYFMDACFTGANRDGSMLVAARGVAREAKKETIEGNTVVFSAASGDETAMPYKEKGHGLFTYFLLKKIQETKGDVSYGELADYIQTNVKKEAFLTNEKPQNPVIATGERNQNTWKSTKLK